MDESTTRSATRHSHVFDLKIKIKIKIKIKTRIWNLNIKLKIQNAWKRRSRARWMNQPQAVALGAPITGLRPDGAGLQAPAAGIFFIFFYFFYHRPTPRWRRPSGPRCWYFHFHFQIKFKFDFFSSYMHIWYIHHTNLSYRFTIFFCNRNAMIVSARHHPQ